MKYFIDESNISLSYKKDKHYFYISAVAIKEDKDIFKKIEKLKQKYNFTKYQEIKGSDIMTRSNTELRKEVTKEILPFLSGSIFLYDFHFQKMLDITYEWSLYLEDNFPNFLLYRSIFMTNISIHGKKMIDDLLGDKLKENKEWILNLKNYISSKKISEYEGFKNWTKKCFEYILKYVKDDKWIQSIIKNNYQVLNYLIITVLTENNSKEVDLILDEINKKTFKGVYELTKYAANIKGIKYTLKQDKSENEIGIQVADWVASISRKTVYILITNWFSLLMSNNYKELKEEEVSFGNELLLIWKTLFNTKKWTNNLQFNLKEFSFLELITEIDDIREIFKENFMVKMKEKEQERIMAEKNEQEQKEIMEDLMK